MRFFKESLDAATSSLLLNSAPAPLWDACSDTLETPPREFPFNESKGAEIKGPPPMGGLLSGSRSSWNV